MTKLKIITEGNPVLRQRATEVTAAEFGTPELEKLVGDMLESMKAANGVGIAAPQVNVSKRVFIAESSRGPVALVNPVLTNFSKKVQLDDEGCLSVPGASGTVERAYSLDVAARTVDGSEVKFTASGYFARIIQHENDHLDGILFVDRLKEQGRERHND